MNGKPPAAQDLRPGAERLRAQMEALGRWGPAGLARLTGFRTDRVEEWLGGTKAIPPYVHEILELLILNPMLESGDDFKTLMGQILRAFPPDPENKITGAFVEAVRVLPPS